MIAEKENLLIYPVRSIPCIRVLNACNLQAHSSIAREQQARQTVNRARQAAIATSLALHRAHSVWQVRLDLAVHEF